MGLALRGENKPRVSNELLILSILTLCWVSKSSAVNFFFVFDGAFFEVSKHLYKQQSSKLCKKKKIDSEV